MGKNRKRTVAWVLLVLYIGFIIYTTLLCREPKDYREYNFQLFWSWRKIDAQAQQIFLNILFFIPFGVLVPFCVDGSWKRKLAFTLASAYLLSGVVEFLQLVCKLGFSEFDDVFDNTMGAAIGALVVLILGKVKRGNMYAKCFKRCLDFILSLCALIVLSPILLVLIVLGAIFMRGNPFFFQERPGKDEKIFKLIKFRTMDNRKDKDGNLLPDEIRLNKYGRFLRSTSLDELPELINILKGDMSIIGPRPLLVRYLDRYNEEQHHRHDVRPGLTGYAQAHGRNGVSWEDKFAMDVWYTKHITFLGDVKIIWDTVMTVLKREGISSETSATMEEFMGTPVGVVSTWRAPY